MKPLDFSLDPQTLGVHLGIDYADVDNSAEEENLSEEMGPHVDCLIVGDEHGLESILEARVADAVPCGDEFIVAQVFGVMQYRPDETMFGLVFAELHQLNVLF